MTPEIKKRIKQIRRGEMPEGYINTVFGLVPQIWNKSRIDEVCVISSGSTPRRSCVENFSGKIPWVTSGELKNKYITDTSEKISEQAARNSNLSLYEKGTVVIAIYGLEADGVRGTASIVQNKCTISQACMAFTHLKNLEPEFFYYWYLLHGELIGLRYAQGTKQQNLSSEIVGAFIIRYPLVEEQQKIAEILTAQDKIIELKEKLLNEKQRQKKYLMQQLLTGKKRLPGFNKVWNTVELGEIFDYIQPTAYLVKTTDYNDAYQIPVLTAGKTFILGYTNESKGVFTNVPVVIFDDFTTATKYVAFPFKVKSSAIKILTIKEGFNITFAYEAMQLIKFSVGGHERHWISKYSCITIDVPELKEQTAIAEILSTADREIELLQNDIEQEKQKKKALMQLLLTGIVRV